MTREDVIRMAREAGFPLSYYTRDFVIMAERFAALVVAHEREACAMEANYEAARWPYLPESRIPCEDIAAAIRARGEV